MMKTTENKFKRLTNQFIYRKQTSLILAYEKLQLNYTIQ